MTEIYGTLGPACASLEILTRMIRSGMTGVRLNLSHASLRESAGMLDLYRTACSEAHTPPEILIDLQGPCQRIGRLSEPLVLQSGQTVLLGRKEDTASAIPLSPEMLSAISPGCTLLLRDGAVRIQVQHMQSGNTEPVFTGCVLSGGTLLSFQSVKLEGKELYGPVLTESDLENLDLAASFGVTSVMQPFVRGKDDLAAVRSALEGRGLHLRLFAKIETLTGVEHLEEIMPLADTVVIARGDLGNCVPLWELPRLQKEISRKCRAAKAPFMVVTQMLKSMEEHPVPTRAEVSDIFNAVLDGASSVMITSESAIGRYPVQAMDYLVHTVREAEAWRA